MKVALDNLTSEKAREHKVSTDLVNFFIQSVLLRTKLAVLGATVTDKKGKIDVKDSCGKIVTEVMNLTYLAAKLEIQDEIVPSGGTVSTNPSAPAQVRIVNLATDIEISMQPIINHYFLGMEPGRKAS